MDRRHGLLAGALGLATWCAGSLSFAQSQAYPPPPPDAPRPVAVLRPQPTDAIRVRSGIGLGAGAVFAPGGNEIDGGTAVAFLRLGVQFNHLLSIYYQGMPYASFINRSTTERLEARGMAGINNGLMLGLTLAHIIDLAAGPSLDYATTIDCGADLQEASCDSMTGFAPGAHGRVAVILGGRAGRDVRRSGLSLNFDGHGTALENTTLWTVTGGLGIEWY